MDAKDAQYEECLLKFLNEIMPFKDDVQKIRFAHPNAIECGWADKFKCHDPLCGHTTQKNGTLHWFRCTADPSKSECLIYMRCEKCKLFVREIPGKSWRSGIDKMLYYSCGCKFEAQTFTRCAKHNSSGKMEMQAVSIEQCTFLVPQ